jgi:hypothetical protein
MWCLFLVALNKQICSQKEEAGLHKGDAGDASNHKTDYHPHQLVSLLTYFTKIISDL